MRCSQPIARSGCGANLVAPDCLTVYCHCTTDCRTAGMSMPMPHVDESWQSGEFYANKILREKKGVDDRHVEWVKEVKVLGGMPLTSLPPHYRMSLHTPFFSDLQKIDSNLQSFVYDIKRVVIVVAHGE
eukprot:4514450-Pyramimonas_sp.AAC.1